MHAALQHLNDPPTLCVWLQVELWRADLLSAVVELDSQGNVTQLGIKEQPVYSPQLLLGLPEGMLAGAHISSLLPTHGKSHVEALFTEGGLGAVPKGKGPGGRGKGGIKGFSRRRAVGPAQIVKLAHGTDGAEMELQVQAVVKQDIGTGASLFVLMHVVQPR